MNKIFFTLAGALVVLIAAFFLLNSYIYREKQGEPGINSFEECAAAGNPVMESYPRQCRSQDGRLFVEEIETWATDPFNATYTIEEREIQLVAGRSEIEVAPGSASKLITQAFGEPVYGDLNSDGMEDAALLLTQDSGGSGTFFYLAVAVKELEGYKGTNAIFLGDRIAPQPTEVRNGVVVANYADRLPGEPMTTPPSVGKSLYAKLINGMLAEISAGDFTTAGILKGRITVGPLCPVEPCQGETPDVYSGLQVVATPKGGGRPVDLPFYFSVNEDGVFTGLLPESNYELTLNKCEWLGCPQALPKAIRIEANKTAEVQIDIDTGIR